MRVSPRRPRLLEHRPVGREPKTVGIYAFRGLAGLMRRCRVTHGKRTASRRPRQKMVLKPILRTFWGGEMGKCGTTFAHSCSRRWDLSPTTRTWGVRPRVSMPRLVVPASRSNDEHQTASLLSTPENVSSQTNALYAVVHSQRFHHQSGRVVDLYPCIVVVGGGG